MSFSSRLIVREVITPRGEVVYLDTNLPFRDNLRRAKVARHTRFPLCVGHFDHAIGLIDIKDLLVQLDEPEPSLNRHQEGIAHSPRNVAIGRTADTFPSQAR